MIDLLIAAYKEPELLPTIEDAIKKAKFPEALKVIVLEQDDKTQKPKKLAKNVLWEFVPAKDSKGTCWARYQTQIKATQEFFLQVDGHSRFAQDWDAILMEELNRLGNKAVISSHPTGYERINGNIELRKEFIYETELFEFNNGILLGRAVNPKQAHLDPWLAKTISAAFVFGRKDLLDKCKTDPRLFFYGEEINWAVRMWTRGYDIYHLPYHVIFHDYNRPNNKRFWEENPKWATYDIISRTINLELFSKHHTGEFGFGTERTLLDYEKFANVSFKDRRIGDPVVLPTFHVEIEWFRSDFITPDIIKNGLRFIEATFYQDDRLVYRHKVNSEDEAYHLERVSLSVMLPEKANKVRIWAVTQLKQYESSVVQEIKWLSNKGKGNCNCGNKTQY